MLRKRTWLGLTAIVLLAHYALLAGIAGGFLHTAASEAPALRLRSVPPDAAAVQAGGQVTATPQPSQTPAAQGRSARRARPQSSLRASLRASQRASQRASLTANLSPERASEAARAAENALASEQKQPEMPVEFALAQAPQSPASAALAPLPSAQTVRPAMGPGASASSSPSMASTLGPVVLPGAARLRYKVSGQSGGQPLAGATGELLWQHDGQSYGARLSVRLLSASLRERSSVGSLGAAGLAPIRFSDKARKASEVAAHFERASGKIVFSTNTPEAVLQAGAQDQLSVFLQLGALLAGQAHAEGSSISLQTAGPRSAELWLWTVEPDESLDLPIGPLATRKLSRLPRRDYEQKIELWLAPSLGYLPARIKITEANGNFIDQQVHAVDAP